MAFGNEGYFRVARQDSGGTASTTATSFHAIPIISHTLYTNIPELISDTIRGRYEEGPSAAGIISVTGDVTMRMHPVNLIPFIYGALTNTVTSTQIGSAFEHLFFPVQTRFSEDFALVPWTVAHAVGVDSEEHRFTDMLVNRMTLEFVAAQYMRSTVNMIGRTSSLATAVTVTPPSGVEYTWNQASVSIDAAANADFESITVTIDNALQLVPTLDGTTVMRKVARNGFRTIRVSGTADLPNHNQFDRFRASSEGALELTVVGATTNAACAASNDRLRITIPAFRYTTYPIGIPGPNRISVAFDGRAVFHTGSNCAVRVIAVNTRTAY